MSRSQESSSPPRTRVVFVFVLAYVAIIAAKLARLQRETAELVELARLAEASDRRVGLRCARGRACCEEIGP